MSEKAPFTAVPHEVIEALFQAELKAREYRLILFICRRTYGFHKQSMQMSERKICDHIGGSRGAVRRAFHRLVESKIVKIYKESSGKRAVIFGINGDPKTWLVDQQGDPRRGPSGSPKRDPLGGSSGSSKGDPLEKGLVDHPERSSVDHPERSKKWITQGDPQGGSHGDPLGGPENDPQTVAPTGAALERDEDPKDISLKDNFSKENISKIDPDPAPPDALGPLKKGSLPEPSSDSYDLTHYEPESNFGDTENFRGARVVFAYRLLYEADPGSGDLKFAASKLSGLLPAVSGTRRRRDLEGALILAARQLRHDIALGREVSNPWGLVWSLVPEHLEPAKEFNFRIAHGAYPDDPVSYVWDSDNAVLRATKRREEFLRWMDANADEIEKRRVG